ncbi:hypothetical protein ADUPG1_007066, partial [Aduncisulcus paluster]
MEDIIIGKNTYSPQKLIGEGGYAYVYYALCNGSPVALKKVIAQSSKAVSECRKEIAIMNKFRGIRSVPTLLDSCEFKKGSSGSIIFYMAMELCIGGSLAELMIDFSDSRFSEPTIWHMFAAVLKAICPMHSNSPKPIIHRDIKVENILMCTKRKVRNLAEVSPRVADIAVRLCDFGSCTTQRFFDGQALRRDSRLRSEVESSISKTTTLFYRAPEMCDLFSGFPITEKTDIWALGILLYKLAFFCTPYDKEMTNLAIRTGKFSYPKGEETEKTRSYSSSLYHMIDFMLVKNPIYRPTIWEVLEECEKLGVMSGVVAECESVCDIDRGQQIDVLKEQLRKKEEEEAKSASLAQAKTKHKKTKSKEIRKTPQSTDDIFDMLSFTQAPSLSTVPDVKEIADTSRPVLRSESTDMDQHHNKDDKYIDHNNNTGDGTGKNADEESSSSESSSELTGPVDADCCKDKDEKGDGGETQSNGFIELKDTSNSGALDGFDLDSTSGHNRPGHDGFESTDKDGFGQEWDDFDDGFDTSADKSGGKEKDIKVSSARMDTDGANPIPFDGSNDDSDLNSEEKQGLLFGREGEEEEEEQQGDNPKQGMVDDSFDAFWSTNADKSIPSDFTAAIPDDTFASGDVFGDAFDIGPDSSVPSIIVSNPKQLEKDLPKPQSTAQPKQAQSGPTSDFSLEHFFDDFTSPRDTQTVTDGKGGDSDWDKAFQMQDNPSQDTTSVKKNPQKVDKPQMISKSSKPLKPISQTKPSTLHPVGPKSLDSNLSSLLMWSDATSSTQGDSHSQDTITISTPISSSDTDSYSSSSSRIIIGPSLKQSKRNSSSSSSSSSLVSESMHMSHHGPLYPSPSLEYSMIIPSRFSSLYTLRLGETPCIKIRSISHVINKILKTKADVKSKYIYKLITHTWQDGKEAAVTILNTIMHKQMNLLHPEKTLHLLILIHSLLR